MIQAAQDHRQRFGALGEILVIRATERSSGDDHVQERAQDHRADDADLEIALGILGFFRRRRDRVEAVEREEDDRRSGHDTLLRAVRDLRGSIAERRERLEVVRAEGRQRERHEDCERDQLDRHEHQIDGGAFARADGEQPGDGERDHDRRHVDQSTGARSG